MRPAVGAQAPVSQPDEKRLPFEVPRDEDESAIGSRDRAQPGG